MGPSCCWWCQEAEEIGQTLLARRVPVTDKWRFLMRLSLNKHPHLEPNQVVWRFSFFTRRAIDIREGKKMNIKRWLSSLKLRFPNQTTPGSSLMAPFFSPPINSESGLIAYRPPGPRGGHICGVGKYMSACECVCVRQCVTSRKLLSADLHNALFPLSARVKNKPV